MTTRTRTTGKAPWAAVVTALLAVFALVGAMALFGTPTVSATKNIKVTICHATSSHSNPYVEEKVSGSSIDEVQNKLWNGHGDHTGPVYAETVPEMEGWGDIIPAFGSFPGINTDASVEGCGKGIEETFDAEHNYCASTGSGYAMRTEKVPATYGTQDLADQALATALVALATKDAAAIVPPYKAPLFGGANWNDETQIIFESGCGKTEMVTLCHITGSDKPFEKITISQAGVLSGHSKHEVDVIPPFEGFAGLNWKGEESVAFIANGCKVMYSDAVTVPLARTFCYSASGTWTTTTVSVSDTVAIGPQETPVTEKQKSDASAKAAANAQIKLNTELAKYADARDTCPTAGEYSASVPWSFSQEICFNDAMIPVTGNGSTVRKTTVSQAEADRLAAEAAPGEKSAALTTALAAFPGYTDTCRVVAVAAATVSAVEAATVTAPEAVAVPAPATVPVPAAAKPLPATVPAGDGSTVPQVPVALLALLAMATAATVTSGLRIATNR